MRGNDREGNVVIRNSEYWIGPDVIVAKSDKSRFRGFGRTTLDRTARAHLALRHVERGRPVAEMLHFQKRAADRQLDVVGVGKNGEYVDRHIKFQIANFKVGTRAFW